MKLFKRLRSFLPNGAKSLLLFLTGPVVAQFVSFTISPLLSRLYEPEDFGVFTLYTQYLGILLILSGASIFVLIPELKNKVDQLRSAFISFFLFIFVVIISTFIYLSTDFVELHIFIFLIIGVFLGNVRNFYHYMAVAYEKFKSNSKVKIIESLAGSTSNISFGYFGFNQFGLIYSNLIGQFFFILKSTHIVNFNISDIVSAKNDIMIFFKKIQKRFLRQSLSHLSEYGMLLLFSVMLVKKASVAQLGLYSFSFKMLFIPLNIFSEYFSQFLLSKLTKIDNVESRKLFLGKSLGAVLGIGVLIMSIIMFFGKELFSFIFGEKWTLSGEYSEVLIIGFVALFVMKCFQYVLNIVSKHGVYTVYSFLNFGFPVVIIGLYQNFINDFTSILKLIVTGNAIVSILFFFTIYREFFRKEK